MRTTKTLAGLLCLTAGALLMATPVSAQGALQPGRSVSATLADGQVITGRLIGGDSSTLTIDHAGLPLILDRTSIATLSRRSHRSGPSRILGTIGAIGGGLFLGVLAQGLCEYRCDNAWLLGGAIGAGGAGGVLWTVGSSIGAAAPRWDDVSVQAPVSASTQGLFAAAPCAGNNEWTAEGGAIQAGGVAARGMGTFFCEPEMRSGIEIGYLRRPFTQHSQPYGASTITVGDGFSAQYVGLVTERAIGNLPLDPRLVTSLEWHFETRRELLDDRDQTPFYRSDATHSVSAPGFGLGLSIGFNPVRHLSLRTEGRARVAPEGNVNTLSLNAQWRP